MSCGEMVVQKGVFGESVSSLPLQGLLLKHMKTLGGQRGNGLSKNTLLDDYFSARRLRRSFGAPQPTFSTAILCQVEDNVSAPESVASADLRVRAMADAEVVASLAHVRQGTAVLQQQVPESPKES